MPVTSAKVVDYLPVSVTTSFVDFMPVTSAGLVDSAPANDTAKVVNDVPFIGTAH